MLMVMGREDSAAAGVRRLPRRTSREEVITYESPRGEREGGREEGRMGGVDNYQQRERGRRGCCAERGGARKKEREGGTGDTELMHGKTYLQKPS